MSESDKKDQKTTWLRPEIYIMEKNGKREMSIAWMPDEIHFTSNGTRFASYDILDKGEVKIPAGKNIHGYAWDGILAGRHHALMPIVGPNWSDPHWVQGVWSFWRDEGTLLRLLITGTPINHDVYLEDYEVTYSGGFGDFTYSISFIDAREAGVSIYNQKENQKDAQSVNPKVTRPETQSAANSYIVVYGDTLWKIAQKILGNGAKWHDIYIENKAIIEATAKRNGLFHSSNGKIIFPGTVLTIPKQE